MIDTERLDDASLPPWVRREHEERYAFVARHVAGRRVVDCACGSGIGLRAFADARAAQVVGFDVSREAAGAARTRTGDRASVALASGTGLPLRSRTVDTFVSLETIEHIEDDGSFLDEVARVLAPGGVFFCSTPNRGVKNPGLALGQRPINPFHVREYTETEFRSLLASRFGSVRILGQNPNRRWITGTLSTLGRATSVRLLARMQQLGKTRYLLPPLRAQHAVQEMDGVREYEFLFAICTDPLRR